MINAVNVLSEIESIEEGFTPAQLKKGRELISLFLKSKKESDADREYDRDPYEFYAGDIGFSYGGGWVDARVPDSELEYVYVTYRFKSENGKLKLYEVID